MQGAGEVRCLAKGSDDSRTGRDGMSGWIKLEKDRRDDPRVLRMARQLRDASVTHERFMPAIHVTLVLGSLDQLWCYADTHIRDDDTLDLGAHEIDELVGLRGFCDLLPGDWLEIIDADHVKLPGFHTHNGTESKRRALTQKRMARHRNAPASPMRNDMQRTSVTRASPDQTRPDQEETKTRVKRGNGGEVRATRLPDDFSLTAQRIEVATAEHCDPERTFAKFTDYWRSKSGANARKVDWEATWRNWCRNDHDRAPENRRHKTKFELQQEALDRA